MQNIRDQIPLAKFLGAKDGDENFNEYLSSFGRRPKLKVEAHTAYLIYRKHGFSLNFIEHVWTVPRGHSLLKSVYVLQATFLYSNGYDGFNQYQGPLPEMLSFFDSRTEARVKLGKPFSSGGGGKFGPLICPLWDQYRYEDTVMRIDYKEDLVSLITLMTVEATDALSKSSI